MRVRVLNVATENKVHVQPITIKASVSIMAIWYEFYYYLFERFHSVEKENYWKFSCVSTWCFGFWHKQTESVLTRKVRTHINIIDWMNTDRHAQSANTWTSHSFANKHARSYRLIEFNSTNGKSNKSIMKTTRERAQFTFGFASALGNDQTTKAFMTTGDTFLSFQRWKYFENWFEKLSTNRHRTNGKHEWLDAKRIDIFNS